MLPALNLAAHFTDLSLLASPLLSAALGRRAGVFFLRPPLLDGATAEGAGGGQHSGHALLQLPDSCSCNGECVQLSRHWRRDFCYTAALLDMQSGLVRCQSATVVFWLTQPNFRLGSSSSLSRISAARLEVNFSTWCDGWIQKSSSHSIFQPAIVLPSRTANVVALIALAWAGEEFKMLACRL